MKKILFRVLLIGYPILVAGLMLFMFMGKQRRVKSLEEQLTALRQSERFLEKNRQVQKMRRQQQGEIRTILRDFQARAEHFDTSTLAAHLAQVARVAGVELEQASVKDDLRSNGWRFLLVHIQGEGPFHAHMSLLSALEEDDDAFVVVRRLKLDQSEQTQALMLSCDVAFLTEVPWTEQDLAVAEADTEAEPTPPEELRE